MEKDQTINKISEKEERINKLKELRNLGINPYPSKSNRTHEIESVLNDFNNLLASSKKICVAGRLRGIRTHGNLTFANLEDGSGKIQIALSKKELDSENLKENYKNFVKLIDIGDFIEIDGKCFVTHKGEKSIMANSWKILSKAINPLPEKWHGLKDIEDKLRKRYLDILFNPEVKEMIFKKEKFWQVTRDFMKKRGFVEVETPSLEITASGADARPFLTHHNDFDINAYLRICVGELWQKRLMAAGFDKTFEIGRAYRNEGTSPEHLQEFTNLELYWAYANFNDGMKLVKELYLEIAKKIFNKTKFNIRGIEIDFDKDWTEIDYCQEIKKQTGIDPLRVSLEELKNKINELKIKYDGETRERLMDTLWKFCRKNINGPAFLLNEPKIISPLSKSKEDNPELTERFHVIIAGSEIGNGFSELNDPIEQKIRFDKQQQLLKEGDEEAMPADYDFVEMLEYGMPPVFGFGFGERLFSFLIDKPLRETQIFPLMKPKEQKKLEIKYNANDLGIDYKNAQILLDKYLKEDVNKLHGIETEAIMRSLAKKLGENEDKWGIIGLLHDIDWELTKNDYKNHTIKTAEILKKEGASDNLIQIIQSHCYGNANCGEFSNKLRTKKIEHLLAASETLTGLIIASALMQPDKKLENLKLESLKKKFKNKKFAANCNREIIKECELSGISLDEFLEISLNALQKISNKVNL